MGRALSPAFSSPLRAFYFCKNLIQLELPQNLEKIEDYAFIGCKNLESVYCSKKTEIDVNAFLFDKDGEVKFEGVVHYYEEGTSSSEVPR